MHKVPYPHPDELLLKEILKPMGITRYRLAADALSETLKRIKPWPRAAVQRKTAA